KRDWSSDVCSSDLNINMRAYAPDFLEIDENGTLLSETPVPSNPAFVFEVDNGEKKELSLLQIMNSTDISEGNEYKIKFVEAEEHVARVVTLKKDLSNPIIATGYVIFLIGICIGADINHRRIWNNGDGDSMSIAAHTNKNYYGVKKETNSVLEANNVDHMNDKEEQDKSKG